MCLSFGTNFKEQTLHIINPSTNKKIFVFYDPAHMLKLVRNAFGEKKIMQNGKGELIKWDYIQKLYKKEKIDGLRAATKLTSRHIFYKNENMNVRLTAAQVLSDSVGDALMYVRLIDSNFEGCEVTNEFCKMINNAFDILNNRKLYSTKPFNNAISKDTMKKYEEFTLKFCVYIKDMKFENGIKVLESQRKTGFKGLMMGLQNVLNLFKQLYLTNHITFLLTYKLSQDHIEALCGVKEDIMIIQLVNIKLLTSDFLFIMLLLVLQTVTVQY